MNSTIKESLGSENLRRQERDVGVNSPPFVHPEHKDLDFRRHQRLIIRAQEVDQPRDLILIDPAVTPKPNIKGVLLVDKPRDRKMETSSDGRVPQDNIVMFHVVIRETKQPVTCAMVEVILGLDRELEFPIFGEGLTVIPVESEELPVGTVDAKVPRSGGPMGSLASTDRHRWRATNAWDVMREFHDRDTDLKRRRDLTGRPDEDFD